MSTDINVTLGENMSSSQSNLTICVLNPRPVVLKMRSMKPNQAVHNVLFVVAFFVTVVEITNYYSQCYYICYYVLIIISQFYL